jgi:hypothetical protein
MRRHGNLWPRVIAFDDLLAVTRRAARGKRSVASVARFLERCEPSLLSLQRALDEDRWRPGRPVRFEIQDPKRRTISAAPFEDRVVHHALIDPLEPLLDRRMIHESFACRRGKGTHAALWHAQRLVRRHRYSLKLDIRRFFDSLRHEVVLDTLQRILKDRRVLLLCHRILQGPTSAPAVGLPIGNLTSQWFANLVLDRLDHRVKERWRVPGYVRYMDDFVLFADDAGFLRETLQRIEAYLATGLGLRLKDPATRLAPTSEGLPFLGWNLHRGVTRLRAVNLRRTVRRLCARHQQWRQAAITEQQWRSSVQSVFAHLEHGNSHALRRRLVEQPFLHPEENR